MSNVLLNLQLDYYFLDAAFVDRPFMLDMTGLIVVDRSSSNLIMIAESPRKRPAGRRQES
jgi:hypothetical protein